MSKALNSRIESNYTDINKYLELMKANCSELDDTALADSFDRFVSDLISGYLDKTGIQGDIASAIMQSFLDELCLNTENGGHTDFWNAYVCAAQKADRAEYIPAFAGNVAAFIQLIEKQTMLLFDFPDIKGTAERYMREIIEHIQTLNAGRVFPEANIEPESDADCGISQMQDKTEALHDDALLDEKYLAAVDKASSDNISDLQECIDDFDELGGWKDSRELREKCVNRVMQNLSEEDAETENKQIAMSQRKKKKRICIIAGIAAFAVVFITVMFMITKVPEIPEGDAEFLYDSSGHTASAYGRYCACIYADDLVFGYVTYSGSTNYIEGIQEFASFGIMSSDRKLTNILKRRSIQFENGIKGWISYNQKKHELRIHYKGETYLCKGYGI
ncbi:MAG: hypothetical protein UEP31_04895 [Anaerovoracaceae bacterium]|nr:hypothetical protein [Anaerovoracaceae bacterium]